MFTPQMFGEFNSMRVDTPESKVIRLNKPGTFSARDLQLLQNDSRRDATFRGDETCDDDDERRPVPPTKKILRGSLPTGDPEEGRVCTVEKGSKNPFTGIITIGRASNNDIVIAHETVSKVHAFLTYMHRTWYVTDQTSTNKTYLNGKPLPPCAPQPLRDNDKVSFGHESHATFFLPEGLWKFVQLCKSLSKKSSDAKPKRVSRYR